MKKLIKGEWYEFYGLNNCLLQYNNEERTKGWWNGTYGEEWHFNGMSDIAKPASERMLKKYGVIKEMKEKKKLNLGWIYLVASVIHLISSVLSFINGDIVIANTYLILSILFFNWYRDYVSKEERTSNTITSSYIDGEDLIITIEKDRNKRTS